MKPSTTARDAVELGLQAQTLVELRDEALGLAAEMERSAVQRRVRQWKADLQGNYKRMAAWVARPAPKPEGHDNFEAPIHPLDRAEQERDKWAALWGREAPHTAAETRDWCRDLAPDRPQLSEDVAKVDGPLLAKMAGDSKHKSAGLDGWAGTMLVRLPACFWDALASLWNSALDCGSLPAAWTQIRVSLIPKTDGGHRPLAVASVLWRIVGKAVISRLRSWQLEWAHPALIGAMPGRGMGMLHSAMSESLASARRRGATFAGFKADVKKCFDSIDIRQALQTAEWLGLPPCLSRLLLVFYGEQRRFVSWQGVFAEGAIRPSRGLLQGCPFSPLLLNTVMQAWTLRVKLHAEVHMAVYLDDRTCWMTGRGAVDKLSDAAQACKEADRFFGLELHPEKQSAFTNGEAARRQMRELQELMGPITDSFKLLGVHYQLGSAKGIDTDELTAKVQRRSERIGMAVNSLATRRRLLREMVITLFMWAGPWQQYGKKARQLWASSIERALWGGSRPRGRSVLLAWHVLGRPQLHPDFAVDMAAMRFEWHRQGSADDTLAQCQRWGRVAQSWGWQFRPDGCWVTSLGVLRPGWDSFAAAVRAAEYEWFRLTWNCDPKTRDADLDHSILGLRASRQHVMSASRSELRTATACAADARELVRMQVADIPECGCGEQLPTRTHLTFSCASRPWDGAEVTILEQRLLCRKLPLPEPLPCHEDPFDEELLSMLQDIASTGHRPLFATDGGCLVAHAIPHWQRGAWAVALKDAWQSVSRRRRCGWGRPDPRGRRYGRQFDIFSVSVLRRTSSSTTRPWLLESCVGLGDPGGGPTQHTGRRLPQGGCQARGPSGSHRMASNGIGRLRRGMIRPSSGN